MNQPIKKGGDIMARTVWKYDVPLNDVVEVQMPQGSRILKFDTQQGVLTLWALVSPEFTPERRRFRLAGTGHPLPEGSLDYIGSCLQGPFVWHLFELGR